jgi:hypothetical protein
MMAHSKLIGAALPVGHATPTEVMSKNAMNVMGLLGLNQLMLVYCGAYLVHTQAHLNMLHCANTCRPLISRFCAGKEIAQVLRLCTDPTNYPILYHCSSGKDRTGESHPAIDLRRRY